MATLKRVCRALAASGLSVAAWLGVPSAARADMKPLSQYTAVGGDIFIWSAEGPGTTIPLIFFGNFDIADNVWLDVEIPFSSTIDSPANEIAGLGNPTIGVHWSDEIEDKWTLHLGGGASVPLASIDSGDWQFANLLGASAMAAHDSYLWLVDALPLYGKFGVEFQPVKPIFVRGSVEPIFAVPFGNSNRRVFGRGNDFELILQNRFEFEARADVGVGGGATLLPVMIATDGGDNAQVSIEPFFGYDNDHFFMRLGARLALDPPLGPGFDRNNVATLHLRLGGHID